MNKTYKNTPIFVYRITGDGRVEGKAVAEYENAITAAKVVSLSVEHITHCLINRLPTHGVGFSVEDNEQGYFHNPEGNFMIYDRNGNSAVNVNNIGPLGLGWERTILELMCLVPGMTWEEKEIELVKSKPVFEGVFVKRISPYTEFMNTLLHLDGEIACANDWHDSGDQEAALGYVYSEGNSYAEGECMQCKDDGGMFTFNTFVDVFRSLRGDIPDDIKSIHKNYVVNMGAVESINSDFTAGPYKHNYVHLTNQDGVKKSYDGIFSAILEREYIDLDLYGTKDPTELSALLLKQLEGYGVNYFNNFVTSFKSVNYSTERGPDYVWSNVDEIARQLVINNVYSRLIRKYS